MSCVFVLLTCRMLVRSPFCRAATIGNGLSSWFSLLLFAFFPSPLAFGLVGFIFQSPSQIFVILSDVV
eukprot:m.346379 g.346379  ORF g.346379 m.346379 type:complete len:68 (+) comp55830_c0_seq1:2635-2838(+)